MTQPHKNTFGQIIEPWISRQQYALTTFSFLFGIILLCGHFVYDKVRSESDLMTVSGAFDRRSFYDSFSKQDYLIWLQNYTNPFRIGANSIRAFKRTDFTNKVKQNQTLEISIPKFQFAELNVGQKPILAFSISSNEEVFLDKIDTLKNNSPDLDLYLGIFLPLIGVVYYLVRSKRLI